MVLVPFMVALERSGVGAGATLIAAIAYTVALGEVAILPWLGPALRPYFDLSWGEAQMIAVATVALLALLYGLVLGIALALRPRLQTPAVRGGGALLVLWYAALWAAWEGLRNVVPPYFPAATLGASLERAPALLQLASVTGIGGVTAVVVAANAGIARLFARDVALGARLRGATTGVALLAAALAWGSVRLAEPTPIAPDAPTVLAVDVVATDAARSTLDALVEATPLDRTPPPALVLWPESALNLDLGRDRAAWARLQQLVLSAGATLVTGGTGFGLDAHGGAQRFNALHVVRPGHAMESYHKRIPVLLAESWPSFLGAPPASLEPVAAGTELPVYRAGALSFGPLICFEIGDPASARTLARAGAELIVNPSNDAWFRGTEAPHLRWARVRAIESGRPVVRVANAGRSVMIDALGREVAASEPPPLPDGALAAATQPPGVLQAAVPPSRDTLYVATGEVFLPACAIVVLIGVVASVRVRQRRAGVAEAVLRHRL